MSAAESFKPLSWPNDRSHRLGLGSLSGYGIPAQPDNDHDAQGRPTPRAMAGAADTPQTAATSVYYPAPGKVRFVYEGNAVSPPMAVADARRYAAAEFSRRYAIDGNHEDVVGKVVVLGVDVQPGRVVVTLGLPAQGQFRADQQRFPDKIHYKSL